MKSRMFAVLVILALAAWLPLAAQQVPTPQSQTPAPSKDATKTEATAGCCCAGHMNHKDTSVSAKQDQAPMYCCKSKEGKIMACCDKDAKNAKAADCCKGEEGKMCAAKDGKSCCGQGDAKNANACNSKDGKGCCGGDGHQCSAHAHAA